MQRVTKKILLGLVIITLCLSTIFAGGLAQAAGTATMYVSPASGSVIKGNILTISIYENSGSDKVNAVQANLSYPTSLLSYVSYSSSSAFSIAAQNPSGNTGSLDFGRGTLAPVSGAQIIATVKFKATQSSGTAKISFASGSAVIRSSDNGSETLSKTGGSYGLAAPPPPDEQPAPASSSSPSSSASSSKAPSSSSNSGKPSSSSASSSVAPSSKSNNGSSSSSKSNNRSSSSPSSKTNTSSRSPLFVILPIAAAGIIALGVGGLYYMRRRKKQQELARQIPQPPIDNISYPPTIIGPTSVRPTPQVINPTDSNTMNPPKEPNGLKDNGNNR